MRSIADDKVIVLVGKRDTGKSFLVKDLLFYKKHIPLGTVISGTEASNGFYSKIVPPIFIHDEYNEEIIKNALKRQKLVVDKCNQDKSEYGYTNINPNAFLILDDCLYDNSWIKSKYIRNLFMNGRHFKIMFIITMQYALGVPPNLRTNIDYVFLLRENIVQNRKRLYDCYAGMFPSFDMFCQVMDQCTENYECLVINNNAKSNKIEDQVFWYKADPHDDYRIGSREFWEHHANNYKPNHNMNNDDDFTYSRKKSQPLINVKKI